MRNKLWKKKCIPRKKKKKRKTIFQKNLEMGKEENSKHAKKSVIRKQEIFA